MLEILPIGSLRDDDATLFGDLNVLLAKLSQKLPVAKGFVITPPNLHLQTVMEHYDFKTHEVYEESLTLVKKELEKTPIPEILEKTFKDKKVFVGVYAIKSVSDLWKILLDTWIDEVKQKLWANGFSDSLTDNLDPIVVILIDKLESFGQAHFNRDLNEVIIEVHSGKLTPPQTRKLDDLIKEASKKALLSYKFRWILDKELKLIQILPYTPAEEILLDQQAEVILEERSLLGSDSIASLQNDKPKSVVKVYLDLSNGLIVEAADGIFIDSSKIFDLNRPKDSFEELTFKLVDCASSFPITPVFLKLADKSEGMGKVRGTLRLIHQKSLLDPLIESLKFAKHTRELNNIGLVIPFVRGVTELMEIKKRLASAKLTRNQVPHCLEIAVPENILNIEDYLLTGIDGVVLNLDELVSHLNGFDPLEQELTHYKHEVSGVIKFLEDSLKILHKSGVPFVAYGSLSLNPTMLEFLVKSGVHAIIAERYEAHSMKDLLHQAEKRVILSRSS